MRAANGYTCIMQGLTHDLVAIACQSTLSCFLLHANFPLVRLFAVLEASRELLREKKTLHISD